MSAQRNQQKRGVGQIIEMVNSIPDLIPSDKTTLLFALRDQLGDELINVSIEPEYMESMKHIIIAGLFEEADQKLIIEIAYKVYHAEKNGAPIDLVEDLAIVGFAMPITGRQLEVCAKSIKTLKENSIDPNIYEEMISYGLANNWSAEIIRAVTDGLIRGKQLEINLQKLMLAFTMRINRGFATPEIQAMVEEEIQFLKELEERNKLERERRDFAYKKMQGVLSNGVAQNVAHELYLQAIEGNWNEDVINVVFDGVIEAKKAGLTTEKVALAAILRVEQGLGATSPEKMMNEETEFVKELEKEKLALLERDQAAKQAYSDLKPIQYQSAIERAKDLESFKHELRTSRSDLNISLMDQTIQNFLGVPYRWGGMSRYGIDCSGFVQRVYREQGIELPRVSRHQYQVGQSIARNELIYGDLLFFSKYGDGYITHVGIYIGEGNFAHSCGSKGVTISRLDHKYYAIRYVGAKRVV